MRDMVRTFGKIASPAKTAMITVLAFVIAGCSGYNQLLKSNDHDLKFRKALEYYGNEKYDKAIALLDQIAYYYNATSRADSVAYYNAAANYKSGNLTVSSMLLDNFRHTYPSSPFLEDVEYMYAKGFYYESPAPNRDQTTTKKGLMAIDEYLERYPNSVKKEQLQENVTELNQKLHDKAFINAKSYYTTMKYRSAVIALKNALVQYPGSSHREEIMYLIVKSNYLLAENSIASLQRDRYLDMQDAYYNFVSDYPESHYKEELDRLQESAKKFLARYSDSTDTETITNTNINTQDGN